MAWSRNRSKAQRLLPASRRSTLVRGLATNPLLMSRHQRPEIQPDGSPGPAQAIAFTATCGWSLAALDWSALIVVQNVRYRIAHVKP